MREGTDDLLKPSLAGRRVVEPAELPFRLSSQVYVAFFGGALALGGIAAINSVLLGQARRWQAAIVAIALAAEAALVVATIAFLGDASRIASTVAGLAAYGGAYAVQRSADRVYHFHTKEDEPYQSLFGAGLVAVIVARLVEGALLTGVSD